MEAIYSDERSSLFPSMTATKKAAIKVRKMSIVIPADGDDSQNDFAFFKNSLA
jgi:hypothetical protein